VTRQGSAKIKQKGSARAGWGLAGKEEVRQHKNINNQSIYNLRFSKRRDRRERRGVMRKEEMGYGREKNFSSESIENKKKKGRRRLSLNCFK